MGNGERAMGRRSGRTISDRTFPPLRCLDFRSTPGDHSEMNIRLATEADLPAVMAIYNEQILHSVSIFDTRPIETPEAQRAWLAKHDPVTRPVIVAEESGEVVGWASLSDWSEKCSYARAAEVSVYISADHRGKGVGRALMLELFERARRGGVGVLLSRIATEMKPSLALHASLGFRSIGTMRRVGKKFGRILDVELMDYHLDGESGMPPRE
ncbi:MAG: N-acetyltransferase family protein [Phycisphaeraceae bacterium]|nr:MAG: N-acetyltransferase family protein [Phycisphaeraceae bacterium]